MEQADSTLVEQSSWAACRLEAAVSETSQGPAWWLASNGKWYPPTSRSGEVVTHDFNDDNGPVQAHKHLNGGGWVADTAHVAETAFVGTDASVFGTASVLGNASVTDTAWVRGNAHVSGSARISGDAVVDGNAAVAGMAEITDDAYVSGCAQIGGDAKIGGDARVGDEPPSDDDPTYVDEEGIEWWWDGSAWNCWVAERWIPVPGVNPIRLVDV